MWNTDVKYYQLLRILEVNRYQVKPCKFIKIKIKNKFHSMLKRLKTFDEDVSSLRS